MGHISSFRILGVLLLSLVLAGCPEDLATIPNVVGSLGEAVQAAMTAAGLTTAVILEYDHSAVVPEGSVIRQYPEAGQSVLPATPITVVISLGSAVVTIPSVAGKPLAEAQEMIAGAGLTASVVVENDFSSSVPEGSVIRQYPEAGQSVLPATPITVVISLGSELVTIPSVAGKTAAEAQVLFSGAGLTADVALENDFSDSVAENLVIRQYPAAGEIVSAQTPLTIVVSLGPERVPVPDLAGRTQLECQAALSAVGLTLSVLEEFSDTIPAGTIITQGTPPGVYVLSGSAVTATISRGVRQVTVPNLVGLAESAVAGTLGPAELLLGTTTHAYSPEVPEGSVCGQTPPAAAQANHDSTVNIVISLGVGPLTIYVSSSTGDDAVNHGLSEDSPFKTLAHAVTFLRPGASDSMLLKRGDTWVETLNGGKSSLGGGLSEAAPMLISTYGTGERPVITLGFGAWGSTPTQYLTIRGIHFRDPEYDGTNSINGITMGPMSSLVVEDCFLDGVPFVAQANGASVANLVLRRSLIVDNYATVRHSQGVYCDGVNGLTIEDCLLDHNGWKEGVAGAEATMFNHNVYIQTNCTNIVFRRNICTRASSHGIQARPGGIVEDNLFCQNPIAVLWKGAQADVSGRVAGNVILEGNDIGTGPRGWGIDLYNTGGIHQVEVSNNVIAHYASAMPYGFGMELIGAGGYSAAATFTANIIYDWRNPVNFTVDGWSISLNGNQFQDPNSSDQSLIRISNPEEGLLAADGNTYFSDAANNIFYHATYMDFAGWTAATGESNGHFTELAYVDPDRSVGSYHGSLGKEATLEAFLEEVRKQSADNWRDEYTAAAVIAYIKAGFALAPK